MPYEPRPKTGTPLDSAIAEMDVIGEQHPDPNDVQFIHFIRDSLVRVRDLYANERVSARRASSKLFDLYVHNQSGIQDFGSMAGILRVVGDDFGTTEGVDFDELWDLYQEALDRHS